MNNLIPNSEPFPAEVHVKSRFLVGQSCLLILGRQSLRYFTRHLSSSIGANIILTQNLQRDIDIGTYVPTVDSLVSAEGCIEEVGLDGIEV